MPPNPQTHWHTVATLPYRPVTSYDGPAAGGVVLIQVRRVRGTERFQAREVAENKSHVIASAPVYIPKERVLAWYKKAKIDPDQFKTWRQMESERPHRPPKPPPDPSTVHGRLRIAREAANLTQKEVAALLSTTQGAVGAWETAKVNISAVNYFRYLKVCEERQGQCSDSNPPSVTD